MSSTDVSSETAGKAPALGYDMKLEVVTLPVSDIERSKNFYEGLGWRLDADFHLGGDRRIVQLTPPHSECSIAFGSDMTSAAPGSVERLEMVVEDIVAAREDLMSRGVEVSEPFHRDKDFQPAPGLDPDRRTYNSYATFNDPDGNSFLLQEVTTRLPGRVWES
jgi:catechol 2,3-dioxygenase-like lactoylglutathione lyase family enzyme